MATGSFYRTIFVGDVLEDTTRPGVVDTGTGDATLSAGENFTWINSNNGAARELTYLGTASATDPSTGIQYTGFYAVSLSGNNFQFLSSIDPPGGLTVVLNPGTDFPLCFLAGTQVGTPDGAVSVEDLAIGDQVLTPSGAAVPVLWIGRQAVPTLFGLRDADLPVQIAAGALGEGLPARDLRVTAGHALLIDGVLVNASALVNGTTITRIPRADLGDRFTVFHIETENHEIILAEGVASETFVDNASRTRFDNFAEFEALFGAEGRAMVERPEPRALSARQVPQAIRARIAARTAALLPDVSVAA